MAWIDSHAHIDGPEFDADRADAMQRAQDAGVTRMIVIGAVGDISSATRAVQLAESHANVFATVATHPHDVTGLCDAWWETHRALAQHPRVVAVGETGLDYYYDHAPRDAQQDAFRQFLALASDVQKPVVCHIRDAHDDAVAMLASARSSLPAVVIHCFTGTPADAKRYVELDCYVSYSGIVTYKTAEPIRQSLRCVPQDRILLETDCPYLAPVPMRGRRNEPSFLVHTAAVVAQVLEISIEELSARTQANTEAAFFLPAIAPLSWNAHS